jgi:hypothetical protein
VCNEFTAKEIDTSNASQKHAWKKSKLFYTVKSGRKSVNLNNFRFKTVEKIKTKVAKTSKVSSDKKLNGAERKLVIKTING